MQYVVPRYRLIRGVAVRDALAAQGDLVQLAKLSATRRRRRPSARNRRKMMVAIAAHIRAGGQKD
jgi:hypothetical protein